MDGDLEFSELLVAAHQFSRWDKANRIRRKHDCRLTGCARPHRTTALDALLEAHAIVRRDGFQMTHASPVSGDELATRNVDTLQRVQAIMK